MTPIEIALDGITWTERRETEEPVDGELPYATHEGRLKLGDVEITVYQLSDGQRIIPVEEIERLFKEWENPDALERSND